MEKFLGVLFCGGRGTRLGEITKYISKSFVPIYNKPVFKYGLELLKSSNFIDEIVILTNSENNNLFSTLSYKTIIQDDNVVFDMFSGWEFIKNELNITKNGVLVPSDNISNISIDKLIDAFLRENVDIVFSLIRINNKLKLSSMGCYDLENRRFYYKHPNPPSDFGVIAPYIVKNEINLSDGDKAFNFYNVYPVEHAGYWFDIGDYDSILDASLFIKNNQNKQ